MYDQRNLEPSMTVFWFAGETRSRQFLAGGWVAAASLTALSTIQFSKHQSQHDVLVPGQHDGLCGHDDGSLWCGITVLHTGRFQKETCQR